MFVLFVDMRVKPGSQQALEKTYTEIFRPAISRQGGFRDVELLRPNQEDGEWRLRIASGSVAANGKPFCGLFR
jgi:heme-degrading monooxygenase HmoA